LKGGPVAWGNRVKSFTLSLLVLLGLAVALFGWVGCLTILRHSSCDKLDAVRVSYLEPGHDDPGPGSIYVIGVGPGPPRSQILEYLEAAEAMRRAGC
jgi:hypothetical protein